MELETVNKLYLELSQVATAKTARELELEDLLTSARAIAQRGGEATAWDRFDAAVAKAGVGSVTAKVFKVPMTRTGIVARLIWRRCTDGACDVPTLVIFAAGVT